MKYAKYISETEVEFPPINKGCISNYYLAEDLLVEDGYKPFIEYGKPYPEDGWYTITYIDEEDSIQEVVTLPTDEERLQKAKEDKYEEAKVSAYTYLEDGLALYEFEEGKHVEATDGNIAKFTAYALGFASGSVTPVAWCTKEDETVFLNQEQVVDILQGLGAVQAQVWTVKFTNYVQQIEEASTVEEVEAINIDYSQEVEPISVPEEDPVEQETEVFEDIQDIISNNGEEE